MLFLLLACGEKPDIEILSNVHVHETAQENPTEKIGQFFPSQNGTGKMLVTRAKPNTCSRFIEPTEEVEVYNELGAFIIESRTNTVNDSLEAGPKVVLAFDEAKDALIAKKAGYLTFEVTHRVDHMITDTMEFDRCCMENPKACNGYYISSYWKGTGKYTKFRKKKVFFDLIDISAYKLGADIAEERQEYWHAGTKFKQADYYLYEVTPINRCYEWLSGGLPAKTLDRKYFVGQAEIKQDETISFKKSYADAAEEAKTVACQAAARHIKLDKKGKPITCSDVPNIVFQCEERVSQEEGYDTVGALMYILMSDLPEE